MRTQTVVVSTTGHTPLRYATVTPVGSLKVQVARRHNIMIDQPISSPFLQAIDQLLETNTLVLYGRIDEVPPAEMQAVLALLKERFEREAVGYPGTSPAWDAAAAGWAIKIVFHAAQLLLYRSHEAEALTYYFTSFDHPKTAAAIVSADSCLRYLPSILRQLESIDVEDELIPILQEVLREWHYTGLLVNSPPEAENLATILENECLRQLYVDRIIETKNHEMAARTQVQGLVRAAMGGHPEAYWNDLTLAP